MANSALKPGTQSKRNSLLSKSPLPRPIFTLVGGHRPNPKTGTNLSIAVDHKIKKAIEALVVSPFLRCGSPSLNYLEYLFGYQLKE